MLGIPAEPLQRGGHRGRLATGSAVAGGVDALRTVSAENLSTEEIARLLARPRIDFDSILGTVRRERGACSRRGREEGSVRGRGELGAVREGRRRG